MRLVPATRTVVLGVVGAALVATSMVATRVIEAGSQDGSTQTRVCLGADYSLRDGCSAETHQLTQPEFGRAYVVTDSGDGAGVEQYELLYRRANGSLQQIAVRQTSTGKVPRYVLSLGDLSSASPGPPQPGTYELVTQSNGRQSSYEIVVSAEQPPSGSDSSPTSSPTSGSTAGQ